MTTNEPGVIHSGEIWLKSQCLAQEEQLVKDIYACLQQHRYQIVSAVSHTRSCWQRGGQQIVVSLVDDLWDCVVDRSQDTPYLFDRDTTVITDNFLNCPATYRIYRTPQSFYGIYSYLPDNLDWTPDRDYTFAVNRQDYKRMQILLELYQHMGFASGYVNFNCESGGRQEFINNAIAYSADKGQKDTLLNLANQVPIKNHDLEHDAVFNKSWLNIMVETYSSDNVISLSEKIFRCLVTPVPWVAYSGRYTMAKLRELGFDIMEDLVDHSYDRLLETQHKIPNFVLSATNTISKLKTQDWAQTKSRCQAAAFHNQQLLFDFSRIWNENQITWLQQLSRDIR